jgi:hypothetical protein
VTWGQGDKLEAQRLGGSVDQKMHSFQVAGSSLNQRETGDRMIGGGYILQVPGLGGQVSGTGVLVRVRVQENPEPEPGAET